MKKEKSVHKLVYGLFAIVFAFGFNGANAQTPARHFSLYVCMNNIDAGGQKYLNDMHIQQVALFDSRFIDPNNSNQCNTATLTKAIVAAYPDSTASGIASLDWEGDMLNNLTKDTSSAEFKNSINEFSKAIQLAKTLRPNVKWGFYFIPFTTYYNRNTKWMSSNQQIAALLQQCDILFPSVYIYYQDGRFTPNDNEAYAADNINEALKLGVQFNKPVLPFVWHRYHDSNHTIGLQLVPKDDFRNFITKILTTSYKNKHVDGLIWWGADGYFYRVKSAPLVNEFNSSGAADFGTYFNSMLANYGNLILDAMKNVK